MAIYGGTLADKSHSLKSCKECVLFRRIFSSYIEKRKIKITTFQKLRIFSKKT